MVTLEEIFDVKYGVNLELNKLEQVEDGINFVSRTAKNNGVSAVVKQIENIKPIAAGMLTVAGGGSVLETFLQTKPFYSGRDLYYLVPKVELSDSEKLYYCMCIRANKYRYNYGRQANRTLKTLLVPSIDEIPKWVEDYNISLFDNASLALEKPKQPLNTSNWKTFYYNELFDIERGRGPRKKDLDENGSIPFVSSTDRNNGVTGLTTMKPIHKANTIGVNRNGSVGEAFYQEIPFCSTEDVHIFNPKFPLNKYIAMFLNTLIRQESYRYNYGRKWGIERMKKSTIKLPIDSHGNPNWRYMESYIKALAFSSSI